MFINSFKKKCFPYRRLIILLLITGLLAPDAARAMDDSHSKEQDKPFFLEGYQITQKIKIEGDSESWVLMSGEDDPSLLIPTKPNTELPILTNREIERLQKEKKPKPPQSSKSIFSSWSNEEDN